MAPNADALSARCRCGTELWARRKGELTLANRILKATDAGIVAKCPSCAADVPIPFLQLVAPTTPRMVVRLDGRAAT